MYLTKTEVEKIKEALEPFQGKVITLVTGSEWGFGHVCICGKYQGCDISRYAQYDHSLLLKITPKRKRNVRGYRFHGEKSFRIFSGEVQKLDEFKPARVEGNITIRESRYSSCDERYITDYGTENMIVENLRSEVDHD